MKKRILSLFVALILALNLISCGNGKDLQTSDNTAAETIRETKSQETTADITEAEATTSEVVTQETETAEPQTMEPATQIPTQTPQEETKQTVPVQDTTEATAKGPEPTYQTVPNSYPNTFSLITSATSYEGGVSEYMLFLKNSGATEVSSTEQAISLLKDKSAKAVNGLNICFNDGVSNSLILDALPKESELGNYVECNMYRYETRYTSNYFGVKLTWWTTEAEEAKLNARISQVAATFSGSNYNKIKAAHDYICNQTDYCYETYADRDNNYAAYDALFGGKAVCQGYALAFQKFMDTMGIPCYIAKGTISSTSGTQSHAWNIVQLEGEWYYVDCTWDGQDSITVSTNLLRGPSYNGFASWGGITIADSDYLK